MRIQLPNGTFEIENIDFVTRISDQINQSAGSKEQHINYLMSQARGAVIEALLKVDDVFTVESQYNIATMDTLYHHRLQVLRRINDGTK